MTPAQFTKATAGIPYVSRGMFFSELYLFTVTCLEHGVEWVIESGVRNGLSTRVLRVLWPGRLESVENKPGRVPADLQSGLIVGDGFVVVPELIEWHRPMQVGVLLDGPKGPKGDELRAVCLRLPNVKVVAQHDIPSGQGETTHSQVPRFRQKIGDALDARIPANVRNCYPKGAPGLSIWVRP